MKRQVELLKRGLISCRNRIIIKALISYKNVIDMGKI